MKKLPSLSTLATALRNVEVKSGPSGSFMTFDKTGCWTFGADALEVEDGSEWAINPFSFVHGFIAWGTGSVLSEVLVPVSEPLPEVGLPPDGARRGWELKLGFALKCLTGDDKDTEALFATNSAGGKRAVQGIAVALAEQIETDPSKPIPVVKLSSDHYKHKEYGKIYTPVLEIVRWIGDDGTAATEDEPLAIAAPEEPTRRRRRAS